VKSSWMKDAHQVLGRQLPIQSEDADQAHIRGKAIHKRGCPDAWLAEHEHRSHEGDMQKEVGKLGNHFRLEAVHRGLAARF